MYSLASGSVPLVYDVNHHLIGEAVNGVPQRWTVYDGSTPYLDLTGTGQVSERYLADPNALAQYWARVGQTGQADWMVTDLLGSVRALVSASGSVEDQIAYDAYGNIVTETNPSAGGRLKYAGGQYDGGLGLTLFGARWYNSAAGRWLSQDPLGLGPDSNAYRYVGNGPTDGTDPSGLITITFPWNRPNPREAARLGREAAAATGAARSAPMLTINFPGVRLNVTAWGGIQAQPRHVPAAYGGLFLGVGAITTPYFLNDPAGGVPAGLLSQSALQMIEDEVNREMQRFLDMPNHEPPAPSFNFINPGPMSPDWDDIYRLLLPPTEWPEWPHNPLAPYQPPNQQRQS
jgi:RHS repeat-associated protein